MSGGERTAGIQTGGGEVDRGEWGNGRVAFLVTAVGGKGSESKVDAGQN